ncbi:TIR domain-containing protein [Flagellimonas iocasae]|uniref:TIR domain-containing protein n=1 Tax=Flagellimonas iocasae TaxID=2055905 RepID=A0ABW4XUQ6_9FLAO
MIKPRVFIGSSVERLNIAYSIQENLEKDCESTVWTQGIFDLSKSTLTSLIDALKRFNYAIFVFHPDDMAKIRSKNYSVVRDNLIFELGLFMGQLGQENVFFLIPESSAELHLPTDLLGITPGTYNSSRSDGNLNAALGPFCNKVRVVFDNFVYLSLEGFESEPNKAKEIVLKKPLGWEYKLAFVLLESKISVIDKTYEDIENELVIQNKKSISGDDFFDWFKDLLTNYQSYIQLFVKCLKSLQESFGPPGKPGKPNEIKKSVDNLIKVCDNLIGFEKELLSFSPPEELFKVKSKVKGASRSLIIDPLKDLQSRLEQVINQLDEKTEKVDNSVKITLTPVLPKEVLTVVDDFRKFRGL